MPVLFVKMIKIMFKTIRKPSVTGGKRKNTASFLYVRIKICIRRPKSLTILTIDIHDLKC